MLKILDIIPGKRTKDMIKLSIKYIKIYKFRLLIYLILSLLCGFLLIVIPSLSGKIIDLISYGCDTKILILYVLIFTMIQFLCIFIKYYNNRNYIYLQTNSAFKLISDLISHIQKLPICKSETLNKEYLNQKINNDSNSIISFTINIFSDMINNILSVILSVILLAKINNIICFLLLCIGLLYLFLYIILRKYIYNKSLLLKEEQAKFFSVMLDQISLVKFINIHGLYDTLNQRFNKSYEKYFSNVLNVHSFFIYIPRLIICLVLLLIY